MVGWKTGSRGVEVGSEYQLFFLFIKEIIKLYFTSNGNDVFGEFLLCLKIH